MPKIRSFSPAAWIHRWLAHRFWERAYFISLEGGKGSAWNNSETAVHAANWALSERERIFYLADEAGK